MKFAIIAAGDGSRLKAEGVRKDKPLIELSGIPMIERLMNLMRDEGASEVVVIVNRKMEAVMRFMEDLRERWAQEGRKVELVEKTTPSSMHSLYALSPFLKDEPFCLTTVDTIFKKEEFHHYIEAFRQSDADGLMAVTDYIDDEKPLYVGTDEEMNITGYYDDAHGCRYISGGIYCLRPKALETLQQCIDGGQSRMRNFQRQMVADGFKLKAYRFEKIMDVDHAADITAAESFTAGQVAKVMPRIAGIRRSAVFSPNSREGDDAIFNQVALCLGKRGREVCCYDEQSFPEETERYSRIFTMARSKAVLQRLEECEQRGSVVVNSSRGVRQCGRPEMTRLLQDHGLPAAQSWVIDLTDEEGMIPQGVTWPCWMKRGDACAQQREDVSFLTKPDDYREAYASLRRRGIRTAVVSTHLPGDVVKFYGVGGSPFFYWYYPTLGQMHSKFGLEEINGPAHQYSFDVEAMKRCTDLTASIAGVPVYGGDCIVGSDGTFRIIDFNDWPSFSRCVENAAEAIADCIIGL